MTCDWSYLGGLFDGEGHVSLYYTNGLIQVNMNVANTSEPLMAWLINTFDGRVNHKTGSARCSYWYPPRPLEPFVVELLPYVKVKKENLLLLLEYLVGARTHRWDPEEKIAFAARSKALNGTKRR